MSFKGLFSKSLSASPGRLHMAAHSHHLWPDASFEGQVECWEDAARLADRKWDRIMDEVWPEAQEFGAIDYEFRDAGLKLASDVRQASAASRKKRGT